MRLPNLTPRERCERRLSGMKSARKPYEADWQEISRLFMPTRSEILNLAGDANTMRPSKRRANQATYTSKGRRAARILANGMTTGMSSSAAPWFKLKTPYPDMDGFQPVKEWLSLVERLIYDFLASTNFYNASKIGYAELGCYGTEVGVMLEHEKYGAVTHPLTAGEYWIANDDGLVADTLYRRVWMTVHQMVQAFVRQGGWGVVSKAVKKAYDEGSYETMVPVMHACEPNLQRDDRLLDNRNMEFQSIWWEEGQSNKDVLLRRGGYEDKCFWAPRWMDTGGEVTYGDGPGYDALPDGRSLQLASKRRGRNLDMQNKPPMGVPTGMSNSYLTLDPGSLVFGSINDLNALKPLFNVDPRTVQANREEAQDLYQDVMECFYADLFFAISDMEGVQPRNEDELFLRNQEKLTQLGPVVERVNVEKLEVVIDRAFAILLRYGKIPPAPRELQGQPLRVDFVSMLAQAQKAGKLGDITRTAQFVGFLAGLYPDAALKLDPEQAIDEFATGAGTPPSIIRTDEVVKKMKQQMAQQQAAQQAAEMMPAMREGAQAAELMSRTQVGDETALERMTMQ